MTRNGLNNTFSRPCTDESRVQYAKLLIQCGEIVTSDVWDAAKTWSTLRMMQETANLHRRIAKDNEQ